MKSSKRKKSARRVVKVSATVDLVLDRDSMATGGIDPRRHGCHMAVLAQSGSGKSFMVGRLIEELLIKTKARVVVLDPNSDFVCLGDANPKPWTEPAISKWFFPGETATKFATQWRRVKKVVLSNRNFLRGAQNLLINWGSLTDDERAHVMGIERERQAELYSMLELAGAIAGISWDKLREKERKYYEKESDYDFELFKETANDVCSFFLGSEEVAEESKNDIAQHPLAKSLGQLGPSVPLRFRDLVASTQDFEIWRKVGDRAEDIAEIVSHPTKSPRVLVVDLLSVEKEAARTALTQRTLSTIWQEARKGYSKALIDTNAEDKRVPTFLVIDEAHNVVPAVRSSAASERLAADVIRIAAEGRKFGLFLLLVTQRPRKLDQNVLSECDGLYLMKMTNSSDLEYAAEAFGFVPNDVMPQTKNLKVGECFLLGRLGGTSTVWHVAPRRTMEGGRSLNEKYWTTPYQRRS